MADPFLSSEWAAFCRGVAAAPLCDTARLAAADWLDETGDETALWRAELIRLQVEMARMSPLPLVNPGYLTTDFSDTGESIPSGHGSLDPGYDHLRGWVVDVCVTKNGDQQKPFIVPGVPVLAWDFPVHGMDRSPNVMFGGRPAAPCEESRRYLELRRRERELLTDTHCWLDRGLVGGVGALRVRRGFLNRVVCWPSEWERHADEILGRLPVLEVDLQRETRSRLEITEWCKRWPSVSFLTSVIEFTSPFAQGALLEAGSRNGFRRCPMVFGPPRTRWVGPAASGKHG
jgi:uncharacterized protein (TIGR02996 family)